jgi:hypothetical protein
MADVTMSEAILAKETAMKIFTFWLFVALLTQIASSDASAATQEIEIIKFSCRQLPKAIEPKEIQDRDMDTINDGSLRGKSGLSNDLDTTHKSTTDLEAKKYDKERRNYEGGKVRSQDYEYKLEVKNRSTKKIVNLKWAYVFTDPVTQKQLIRHSFDNKVNIKPDTQKTIVVYTDLSLPKVVNVQAQTSKGTALT